MLNAKIAFCISKKFIQEIAENKPNKNNDWNEPVITDSSAFVTKGEGFISACYRCSCILPEIHFWEQKEDRENSIRIRPAWLIEDDLFIWSPVEREFVQAAADWKDKLILKTVRTVYVSKDELPLFGQPVVVYKSRQTRKAQTTWKNLFQPLTTLPAEPIGDQKGQQKKNAGKGAK